MERTKKLDPTVFPAAPGVGKSVSKTRSSQTEPSRVDADLRAFQLPDEARVMLTDSYLLRRWTRQSLAGADTRVQGQIQEQGRKLFGGLRPLWDKNMQAAGESGLLAITEGELDSAVALLREAVRRFPGSTWVRFVLGRAERELALRDQLRLSDESERQVISPWRALGRAGEHFVPVQNLGEGRAWLALVDGSTVATHAQTSFGKLAHWVHRFVEPIEAPADHDNSDEMIRKQFQLRPQVDSFVGWWAREVQVYLFGSDTVTNAEDIERQFDSIRDRLRTNRETLDTLEEDYVRRYSRA